MVRELAGRESAVFICRILLGQDWVIPDHRSMAKYQEGGSSDKSSFEGLAGYLVLR